MRTDGYDRPEIYDLVSGDHGDDIDFFVRQASLSNGPVLELACGTGRILNRLASTTDADCTGIDLSQAMIHAACRKAEAKGLRVKYVVGDMRTFSLGQSFGLIFIPMNSLLHLEDQKSVVETFANVKKHLRPGGMFQISIFNPSESILSRNSVQRFPVTSFKDPVSGELVSVEETTAYDSNARINTTTWYYSTKTRQDFYSHEYRLQVLYPSDMKRLIAEAGFDIAGFFGDYDSKPFEERDRFQIYTLRVR